MAPLFHLRLLHRRRLALGLVFTVAAALACARRPPETVWTSALALGLEGQGWTDLAHPYDRLPAHAEGVVREAVWNLGHNTAGLCVRFVTDSPQVRARWRLRFPDFTMDHMADTGISGLDLYARDGATWRWVAVGRVRERPTNTATLVESAPPGLHEYLLFLPLYNGVERLEIGVVPGARIAPGPARPESHRRPVVFYGTSITQGGCASRAGMAYPAIIGRALDRPTINLGFSGNGRMDLEMAALLGEIDAAVYVLDAVPNMDADGIAERMAAFVRILRAARPETPIVLVENIVYENAWFDAETRETLAAKRDAVRAVRDALAAEGLPHLVWVEADGLIGDDGQATVDGVHPTDAGFLRLAEALTAVIRPLLER